MFLQAMWFGQLVFFEATHDSITKTMTNGVSSSVWRTEVLRKKFGQKSKEKP